MPWHAGLDPPWAFGAHAKPEGTMDGKAKFVFPVVITAIIVFVVSGVVTFINIGFRGDYLSQWMLAFIMGWPVAAVVAFFAIPLARRITQRIVAMIEGSA
jgi:hypothetical protein